MSDVKDWNTAAASNNSASPNGFPEGMAPSGVNNSAREVMAAVARYYADTNGTLDSGGAANAYTLTPNDTYSAYTRGDFFVFEANHTNTGAATLNVSAISAQSIVRHDGSALEAGDLTAGGVYAVYYDGTNFQLSGRSAPDLNELTTETSIDAADYVAMVDVTDDGSGKITFANFEGALTHDNLTGVTANEHVDHSTVSVTAGTLLDGGGTIDGNVTLNVDLSELSTSVSDGDGDFFAVVDGANAQYKLTKANIALSGFNNDSGFTTNVGDITNVTAGTGLSGGGASGSVTVNLDISGITNGNVTEFGQNDSVLFNDGGTMKQMDREDMGVPLVLSSAAQTFAAADLNTAQILTGATPRTFTVGSGLGNDGAMIIVGSRDTAVLTIAGSGVTITSASGNTGVSAGGMALLYRVSSTEWMLSGDLE